MSLVKITALDTFAHNRLDMARGATAHVQHDEAKDLEQKGLVSIGDPDDGAQDDLIHPRVPPITTKMAPAAKNKMEPPAEDKAPKAPEKAKK